MSTGSPSSPPPPTPAIVLIGSYLVALVMDVERIPIAGETVLARNFREVYGGKGSDMAVQARRLGAPVHFVGCVGADDFGRAFIRLMEEEGADLTHLAVRGELATGAGFIVKSASGHNLITIDIGANQLFAPADVDRAAHLMTPQSVVLIQLEIPPATALQAVRRGAAAGSTVILNPAPAQDLRGVDLTGVDYLTPNETEARVCLGLDPTDPTPDADLGRRLLGLGCRAVLMTLGERGCLLVTAEEAVPVPAWPIAKVVDSTGAGDAFNAALATALLEGQAPVAAARFANAAAGLCCTRWETVPSYHTRAEVEALMAHKPSGMAGQS